VNKDVYVYVNIANGARSTMCSDRWQMKWITMCLRIVETCPCLDLSTVALIRLKLATTLPVSHLHPPERCLPLTLTVNQCPGHSDVFKKPRVSTASSCTAFKY